MKNIQNKILINAVLTSTILVTPMVSVAAEIIDSVVTTTLSTSDPGADGTIIILPSGQVNPASGNAIVVNNFLVSNNVVNIEPSNIHPDAVLVTNATGNGFLVNQANAKIIIGAGSAVTLDPVSASTASAILILSSHNTITNAGIIQSIGPNALEPPIKLNFNSDTTTINNEVNGVIQAATKGPLPVIHDTSLGGMTINNAGLITDNVASSVSPVILLELSGGSFNSINNNAGGQIINSGSGVAIEIAVNPGGFGDIINNVGGIIQSTIPGATAKAIAVFANMNNIINHGLITAPGGNAIFLGPGVTINQITNAGELIATNGGTVIQGSAGVTIRESLINTGNINAVPGSGGVAIDFSGVESAIVQQSGTITGDVLLGLESVFPISVSGGVIDGNIVSNSGVPTSLLIFDGGAVMRTVTLNGPSGDAVILTGDAFVNQFNNSIATFDISGGFFNAILGANAIFIQESVTFGNPPSSTLLASNGVVQNVGSIEIREPGTVFTANAPITGIRDSFMVDAGTTFIPNNLVQFAINANGLNNSGTIIVKGPSVAGNPVFDFSAGGIMNVWVNGGGVTVLTPTGVMTVMGNDTPNVFVNLPDSTLVVQIAGPMGGPLMNGQLVVNSVFNGTVVELESGSLIFPQFTGFIPNNQVLDVITVNDGTNTPNTISNAALVVQSSAVVFFTPNLEELVTGSIIEGEVLQLISHRNTFTSLANGITEGVAGTLDFFAQGAGPTNAAFFTLITQLDQIATVDALNEAMESLVPPFNYGLIEGSHIGMDSVFEGVTDRVWDVAWHHREHGRRHHGRRHHAHPHHGHHHRGHHKPAKPKGLSSGDLYTNAGIWLRPIGAYVSQNARNDIEGYRAKALGGALGVDVGVNDCTTVGAAVSYTRVHVDDKDFAPKNEHIKSWMGTLYGSFDFEYGIFFDAMVAGAHNDYRLNRVIAVNDLLTTAQASFDGSQWGVQGDLGIALPNQTMFVAPFVRLKYIHLSIDDFTEHGAGELDLHVSWNKAKEFLGGVGLRLATDFEAEGIEWVPEFMFMFAYDFDNDGEVTVANFIGGGPAFATHGAIPGRAIFDGGLALNALIGNCSVVTAKYNLELRENFAANSAYLQYYYNWS